MRSFWVYILSSRTRVLYIGVTNDLARRLAEHRAGAGSRFTTRYRVTRLVHAEEYCTAEDAIRREKEIKAWRREKKRTLIEAHNPEWQDLTGESGASEPRGDPSLRSG
jgi:putative endonuclease